METPEIVPVPEAKPVHMSLKEEVAAILAGSSKTTFETVRDHLVQEELNTRKTKILSGLTKLREAQTELKKVSKPDVQHVDGEGKEISMWTKPALEVRKKAEEKVKAIETALNEALAEKSNYDKLNKLIGGQS